MEGKARVYNRDETAKELKLSIRKTDELILSKQLPSFKIGRRRYVSERALADFIARAEKAAR